MQAALLGRLSWADVPLNQPIPLVAAALVALVLAGVLALVTVKGWWPYLWREWITSVDHKRIGVMYVLLALVMLIRGFVDAIMMRSQLDCSDDTLPAQVACNDDGCGGSPRSCTAGLRSSIPQALGPGLFYLVVDGYSTNSGAYTLNISGY